MNTNIDIESTAMTDPALDCRRVAQNYTVTFTYDDLTVDEVLHKLLPRHDPHNNHNNNNNQQQRTLEIPSAFEMVGTVRRIANIANSLVGVIE